MAKAFTIEAVLSGRDMLSRVMDRIGKNMSALDKHSDALSKRINRGFSEISKSAGSFAEGIKSIGVATAAVSAIAGAGLVKVFNASNDLADGVAKVATVITPMSGTVVDATNRMKIAALDWSKAHRDSARSFLDASYMMISAGLNEQAAAAATRTGMLTATATFGDATEAASLIATIYNNLADRTKDVNKEIGRLGDIVTKTQQTFQLANLSQLNESLKYGIPTALQYRMAIEDLSAVLGQLNNAGLVGSMAGTSFAATMRSMEKASKDVGFTIAKNAQGGVDFVATLQGIETKFGSLATMTDGNRAKFAKAFGDEGFRGLSLLIGKSGELSANLAKVKDSAGAAATAAAEIESKGSGPLKILRNRIEAVAIGFGDALAPAVAPLIDRIGKVVDAVGAWSEANKGLITGGIEKALNMAGPALTAFGQGFMAALPAIQGAVNALFQGFGGEQQWVGTLVELATILGKVTAGAIGVGTVFGGMVMAGIQIATREVSNLIGVWNGMINGIGRAIFFVDDFIGNFNARVARFHDDVFDAGRKIVTTLVDGITSVASKPIEAMKGIVTKIRNLLPFSPAKEGPLRDLHRVRIVETIAETVTPKPLVDSITNAVERAMRPLYVQPKINALSLGGDRRNDDDGNENADGGRRDQRSQNSAPPAHMVSPQERVARSVNETKSTTTTVEKSEVLLKLPPGVSADVRRPPGKKGAPIRIEPSGGM